MQPSLLSDLDLAALLCSRVCHDVISPVGAITNGLELLEVEDGQCGIIGRDLVNRGTNHLQEKSDRCSPAS